MNLWSEISSTLIDTPLNYFGPGFFGKLMPEIKRNDFELDSISIGDPNDGVEQLWSASYRFLPMYDTYSVYFDGWKIAFAELDD